MKAIIEVDYQSQWEEGYCDSKAKLNLRTGEVFDIEDSEDGAEYECHLQDVIFTKDDTEVLIDNINGYDYAIDTQDILLFVNCEKCNDTVVKKMIISCEEDGTKKYIKTGFLADKHLYTCALDEASTFTDPQQVEQLMRDYKIPKCQVEVIEIKVTKQGKTLKDKYAILSEFA